jgi:hypothetical protein
MIYCEHCLLACVLTQPSLFVLEQNQVIGISGGCLLIWDLKKRKRPPMYVYYCFFFFVVTQIVVVVKIVVNIN